eukprot:TRINITY_DN35991_c0_g1_i3.p1 TRINITY_DN35991_c0_g1~~TRINITY_DN35991_c0_g1_i3.p1  ORF type:complete len:128 (+),score=18.34 TRINITY_DN35991_c0_g1_i3:234-617(+)
MKWKRHGPLVAADGRKLYVCGGFDRSRLGGAEIFDATTETWDTFEMMPKWRRGAVAAAVAGKLYVCGGQANFYDSLHLNSVDRYDPVTRTWQALDVVMTGEREGKSQGRSASMSDCRRNAAAATIAL